jgi:hypothetical protein
VKCKAPREKPVTTMTIAPQCLRGLPPRETKGLDQKHRLTKNVESPCESVRNTSETNPSSDNTQTPLSIRPEAPESLQTEKEAGLI